MIIIFISTSFATGKTREEEHMQLTEIGSYETGGETTSVVVRENIAFVLDVANSIPGGLVIINVSDPTNPVLLSYLNDGGIPYAIALKDDFAFIADGDDGIEVINITDLENPIEVYQYPVSTFSSDIGIIDDYLFAANWDQGFEIFNISDPAAPVRIGGYDDYYLNCVQFDIQGDLVCLTDHRNDYTSMRLLDISIPNNPQLLSSCSPTGVDFWDPKIYDDHIYVGNHHEGGGELRIYNISNSENFVYVSEFNNGGSIFTVNCNSSYAFLGDYDDGVEVINIADPSNPVEIGGFFDGGHTNGIYIKGDLLFVADRSDGLEILQTEITTIIVPGFDFQSILFAFPFIAYIFFKNKKRNKN